VSQPDRTPSAATASPLEVLRGYVERAADWGDAGVGHGEAMDADLAEGLAAIEEVRKLLVEADSFISHMLYRGSWPGERWDVERLIGRLRKEGDPVA